MRSADISEIEEDENMDSVDERAPLISLSTRSAHASSANAAAYAPPRLDFELAERLAKESVARQTDGALFPINTPIAHLGSLGTGVGLYLRFVYYASISLLLMTLLSLPLLLLNLQGDKVFDPAEQIGFPGNLIAVTTVGNLSQGSPLLVHSLLDFLSVLAFLGFLVYYRRRELLARKEIETRNITAADYTVHVSHLPPDAVSEDEISAYFSRYGQVASVNICYRGYAERARLMALKESTEEEIAEFERQATAASLFPLAKESLGASKLLLQQAQRELEKINRRRVECCGHAFVTFMLDSSCRECLADLKGAQSGVLFKNRQSGTTPLFRGMYPLKVEKAPQPSDIVWDNIEISARSRHWRQLGTWTVSLVLLLIATCLIALVNGKHFFLPQAGALTGAFLNFICVVIIILSNVAMFILIPLLSRYEGHVSQSAYEIHIMLRLWLFQVLNTLIAAAMFWDASQSTAGSTDWAHWFADGGVLLINVIVGDAVLMNIIEVLRPFDVLIPRKVDGPKSRCQARLNKVYAAPDLSLGMRYQVVLKHFFLALALGAAMPLNYALITFFIIVTFWIDKYNVLRLYKKPAEVNHQVGHVAAVYVGPLALVFHLVITPYLYTVITACPANLFCAPTWALWGSYTLAIVALVILALVWRPLLYQEPELEYDLVRARAVPFTNVDGISNYVPPRQMPGGSLEGRGMGMASPPEAQTGRENSFSSKLFRQEESEIGISVF